MSDQDKIQFKLLFLIISEKRILPGVVAGGSLIYTAIAVLFYTQYL